MRIAENDKIAFPGYLYLPPLLANTLSFMRIYLLREIIATRNCMDR